MLKKHQSPFFLIFSFWNEWLWDILMATAAIKEKLWKKPFQGRKINEFWQQKNEGIHFVYIMKRKEMAFVMGWIYF